MKLIALVFIGAFFLILIDRLTDDAPPSDNDPDGGRRYPNPPGDGSPYDFPTLGTLIPVDYEDHDREPA